MFDGWYLFILRFPPLPSGSPPKFKKTRGSQSLEKSLKTGGVTPLLLPFLRGLVGGRIQRMWEERIYLILLARFTDSRKQFIDIDNYTKMHGQGVDGAEFLRFYLHNNNFFNTFLHYWKLKKVFLEVGPVKGGLTHELTDRNRAFLDTETRLNKRGLLTILNAEPNYGQRTVRIEITGRKFVRFFPFYEALQQEYPHNFSFFFGGGIVAILGGLAWVFKLFG